METIKSSAEISQLFATGHRVQTPFLTLIVKKRSEEDLSKCKKYHDLSGRVAFIAGKRLGNAVWRNRAKRRMRAICQDVHGPWSNYDVIFLAKSSLCKASYSKVLSACKNAVSRTAFGKEGFASE